MSDSIIQLLDNLPSDTMTVKLLTAIGQLVPGQWENVVGCDNMIVATTGETDADKALEIRNRVTTLYNDGGEGYQQAVQIYDLVDKADAVLGEADLRRGVAQNVPHLSFLERLVPKADTTQSVDLCVKIVAELIAYSKLNGLPNLSPQEFATALSDNYQGPSLMRMGALVAVDGLLPLGPNFLQKVERTLTTEGLGALDGNSMFSAISGLIPSGDKLGFIAHTFGAVEGWMGDFVSSTGLTREKVFDSVRNIDRVSDMLEVDPASVDLLPALLDLSTRYFRYTGIQSVARRLIQQAAEGV